MIEFRHNDIGAEAYHTAYTSAPMTGQQVWMTTDASMPIIYPGNVIRDAKKYVERQIKEFLMHIVKCDYCWSQYVASPDLGYECPACTAQSFEIIETINNEETIIERSE